MSEDKTTLDTEVGKIEIDSEGNLVLSDVKFPPYPIDVRPEPLPQRNVNCMTMRQHFALEIYKSSIAGHNARPNGHPWDISSVDYIEAAIQAADYLLAKLEKDEK
jgi:hypothetical protein